MPQRMLRDTWEAGVRRTEATGSAYVLTTSAFALGSPVPRSCTLQSGCVPDISWGSTQRRPTPPSTQTSSAATHSGVDDIVSEAMPNGLELREVVEMPALEVGGY